MRVILFEDQLVDQLYPIAIGRPAFEISCGSYRLVDLMARLGGLTAAVVRPHLHAVFAADSPDLARPDSNVDEPLLLVNARLVPRITTLNRLRQLVKTGILTAIHTGSSVAAAFLPSGVAQPGSNTNFDELTGDFDELTGFLTGLPAESSAHLELPLFEYPHDVIRYHQAALAENLEDRLARGVCQEAASPENAYQEIDDGLFVASGVKLGKHVVVDSRKGPILLDENVRIGPYCYLSGPAYMGAGSRVIEHAAVKDGVALGHTTKVGGEVEASTIEPYTNKQHHGFLGHSYLGSWVNLGAGTCNSDLKNTYGPVTMEYDGRKVPTDMQFLGCIVGDYSKTAINTSIFTGKTIGVCTMVYGFVTTNVPSFVNYARSFGQVTEAAVEVMATTQERMFERRGVTQRPCDIQLLHDMYRLSRHERQLASEPPSL